MSLYEHFIETIEHVPSELQRNFKLMSDLDHRTKVLIETINERVHAYKDTTKRSERESIYKDTVELFTKAKSYADDKVELALQTYELVDKHIRRLESMGPTISGMVESSEVKPLESAETMLLNMPVDPNEPLYCVCKQVSHGEMIACDNRECQVEWFHFPCVNLKAKPKGKWYCPDCFTRTKKQKTS